MRFTILLVVLLSLSATVMGQRNPFQMSDAAAVKRHCLGVAQAALTVQDRDSYRAEVMWDVAARVKPNCEIMVGIPDTQYRSYSVLTLPTNWQVAQIAGMISEEIQEKAHPGILRRIGRAIKSVFAQSHPELYVKGLPGVYEVKEFSAAKLIEED